MFDELIAVTDRSAAIVRETVHIGKRLDGLAVKRERLRKQLVAYYAELGTLTDIVVKSGDPSLYNLTPDQQKRLTASIAAADKANAELERGIAERRDNRDC